MDNRSGLYLRREIVTQDQFDRLMQASIRFYGKDYIRVFQGKDLSHLNMRKADFRGMDLSSCNMEGANLEMALFEGADLTDANLNGTNLFGADLCANLCGVSLCGANIYYADLCRARNIPFIPMTCPESGEFTAYKKAWKGDDFSCVPVIVELRIPSHAKRSSGTSRKCRCDMANVIKIYDLDRTQLYGVEAYSIYDKTFVYIPGNMVSVCNFDENRWNECSGGIHFFMSFQEAVEY